MTYQEAHKRNLSRAICTAPDISPEGEMGRWSCKIGNSYGMGTSKESAYKDAIHSMLRN